MTMRYVAAAVLAIAGSGCGLHLQLGGPARVGSGIVTKQSRPVGEFRYVEAGGASEITIVLADKTAAEVEFDDNLLELVSIESRGDKLIIRTRESYKSKHRLKVSLSTPHLLGIQLSGATSAQVHGVKDDKFAIELSGASSARVDGMTQQLAIDASGASKIHCPELEAGSVQASLSGASSAEVRVAESLSVDASGASHLTFQGQPGRVQKRLSGASTVQSRVEP